MATVRCEIEEIEYEPGVDGICLTCTYCDHAVEARGTDESTIRYACSQMRRECPERGDPTSKGNYYTTESGGPGSSLPPDPVPKKWWEK